MRKFAKFFAATLMVVGCAVGAASCGSKKAEIAMVTDVGNIDDKSFNQGTWEGVKEFAEANDKSYAYYRPTEDSTEARVETIKNAIKKGAKIVVCPGYLFEEAIFAVQSDYPEVSFVILDGEPHNMDYTVYHTAPNTHCILYKEEQAGFLAGYAAVQEGYTKLGFIGGMSVPAVIRFGYGYVQGADKAAQEKGLADGAVTVKYNYNGDFSPSAELRTKMDGWYTDGTEIIFSCGGGIYSSVTGAAEATDNGKVIGVDVDQYNESERIVTSATKQLAVSIKQTLKAYYDNNGAWPEAYAGKTLTLGADDDCIGLPTASTSWRLTTFTVEAYNAVYAKVKNGTYVIDGSSDAEKHPELSAKVVVDWNA